MFIYVNFESVNSVLRSFTRDLSLPLKSCTALLILSTQVPLGGENAANSAGAQPIKPSPKRATFLAPNSCKVYALTNMECINVMIKKKENERKI